LKQLITAAINVPADRQRLIFRGRALRDRDSLSLYRIEAGNVVHLVESLSDVPPSNRTGEPATGPTIHNSSFNIPGMMGTVFVQSSTTEIPDEALSSGTSHGQLVQQAIQAAMSAMGQQLAGQLPSSVTSTIQAAMGGLNTPPTAPGSSPMNQEPISPRTISRLPVNAQRSNGDGPPSNHQLVRAPTERILGNLHNDLRRLHGFVQAPLHPASDYPNLSDGDALLSLLRTLELYERLHLGLAETSRLLRQGIASATIPWDRLHNFVAALQELPTMLLVLRRLLSTLRVSMGPNGSAIELPIVLDAPSYMDRPPVLNIDPPE